MMDSKGHFKVEMQAYDIALDKYYKTKEQQSEYTLEYLENAIDRVINKMRREAADRRLDNDVATINRGGKGDGKSKSKSNRSRG